MSNKERHAKLSWEIIKHKILYYIFHDSIISDTEYDALEQEYLQLCILLDVENTVVHKSYPGLVTKGTGMMEVDLDRRSVQLVLKKLQSRGI